MSAIFVFGLVSVAVLPSPSSGTIEVRHEGARSGVSTLRCRWTPSPGVAYDPLTLHGSWRRLCDGTGRESILAIFSASGLVALHPSVEDGESRGRRGSGGLTSVLRLRSDCPGTVVCLVDGAEDAGSVAVAPSDRGPGRVSALRHRGRGLAFRCAPVANCSDYGVEWSFDGRYLSAARFSRIGRPAPGESASNSELTVWSHDRLWVGGTGPWSRSLDGCLTCRVDACGISDVARVCGDREGEKPGPPLAFPSAVWYALYALILVYIVR